MPRHNICMYMAHVCFDVCCSDCVGVCGHVCCVVFSLGVLKYIVYLCSGGDGCYVFVCIVRRGDVAARMWEV